MSPFEVGMLICFGASWPFSLWKLLKTKQCGGVSLRFYALIFVGYLFGLIHKFYFNWDLVVWLYLLNAGLVLWAMILIIKYRLRDRRMSQTCMSEK
ncbi:MAG: hypothetical protein Q4D38_02185 [Planctomycetia bacterium]|nr:hypothetical protein [Planctomycetia bacterium]